ncbi:MAG: GIY-YIG nuclease family protein [Candidatus Magasanikbacteria bacterium]|nr:GIY-YIG nuclease family protein [Candidatus Magasanikbacteria bacterium]
MHSYYTYIMASNSEVLYIGVTNDLARRVSEHKQKLVEGFTKRYNCTRLVYYEDFSDINQAIAREKYLKGKSRKFKEELIYSKNKFWKDLSDEWYD